MTYMEPGGELALRGLRNLPRKIEPYLVAPPHTYFPPWPVESKPSVFKIAETGFTFRFPVGTAARQIFLDGHSYPCKRIILVAPDSDFAQANTQSIFYAVGPSATALDGSSELPPGTSETINIDDVAKLWFIGQNDTDIVFGRVEA
jgi:hypothetical protein